MPLCSGLPKFITIESSVQSGLPVASAPDTLPVNFRSEEGLVDDQTDNNLSELPVSIPDFPMMSVETASHQRDVGYSPTDEAVAVEQHNEASLCHTNSPEGECQGYQIKQTPGLSDTSNPSEEEGGVRAVEGERSEATHATERERRR